MALAKPDGALGSDLVGVETAKRRKVDGSKMLDQNKGSPPWATV